MFGFPKHFEFWMNLFKPSGILVWLWLAIASGVIAMMSQLYLISQIGDLTATVSK